MESTAQREADLHKNLGNQLNALGQPAETVPPHEKPVIGPADFMEAVGNKVGGQIEDVLSDNEGLDKRVRVSPGGRFGRWVLDRARRLIHKKAA